MNLLEILKQFKNITPDPANKEKSKRGILAMTPREPMSAWRIIAGIFETGIAAALAVFFILVITGQFSNAPYVSPVKFSVINPETLNAEAQAVDIQIQLAQVAYEESTTTPAVVNETTPQTASASGAGGSAAPASSGFAPAALQVVGTASSSAISGAASNGGQLANQTATSTPTSTTVSVDQALQALSK